jgi:hypothetical protein
MRHAARAVLPLVAAAVLTACSSPTGSQVEFDITVTATPDPATAGRSSGVQYKVTNSDDSVSYYDYDYRTSFTVTIRDNAGMALRITSINLTVQQATGGIVITPSGGDQVYFKFNSSAVNNSINARGSADVGFDVWYDLPNGGKEALVTVSFNFEHDDEEDNTYTYAKTFQVKVAP